jgi:hypothetical protein
VKAVAGHNLARPHVLSFHQLKDHRRYSPLGALGLLPIVGESDPKQLVQVRICQRIFREWLTPARDPSVLLQECLSRPWKVSESCGPEVAYAHL